VFLPARNTGTSPDMIDRFYGHVKLERMTKELRPECRSLTRIMQRGVLLPIHIKRSSTFG
jgi:hypothetical protein